ncbi:MAG: HAD hydrolase family protein [Chthoniobacterales bacterium]|nr:HAD hydrolase family protein [Chthoniobacterales bacterium]
MIPNRPLSKLADGDEAQGGDGAQRLSVQEHTAGWEAAGSNAEGSPRGASLAGASELLLDGASAGATQRFASAVEFGKRSKIKAIVLDIDGVLTDGTFWWDLNGGEQKRFSFRDVMGIVRAGRKGILFALISGEENVMVDRLAAKLNIDSVYQGCSDKASALRSFAKEKNLSLSEICFMGDDINDLDAIEIAGYSAAPANAHESVLSAVDFVVRKSGGDGAVRELIDSLVAI